MSCNMVEATLREVGFSAVAILEGGWLQSPAYNEWPTVNIWYPIWETSLPKS